jgi:hypothetical protein
MKKIYSLLVLVVTSVSFGQTFYSENMGIPTGTTGIAIATYATGTAPATFQNTAPIVYSGTADVRSTSVSSGYVGASGGGNVFITNTVGRFLQIDGINTSAFSSANLLLSFGYLTSNIGGQVVLEYSTDAAATTPTWTPITFTNNTNTSWNLISIPGGILPASATLSLKFSQTGTTSQFRIDDVKLVNFNPACTLSLGLPTTACDATTLNIDTYTVTIPYTGGTSGAYTFTPSAGTVGGDDPALLAAGNITVSGIAEGTNFTMTITKGVCTYDTNANGPECKPINPLPYQEDFPYTVGTSLASTQKWSNTNAGDTIVTVAGSLSYPNYPSSGNSVSYVGTGSDPSTKFTLTTTGTIYSSFLINVTDISTVTNDLSETVIAALTGDVPSTFRIRLFFKRNGTQYQLGCTSATAATPAIYDATLFNTGTVVAVVIGYDFTANQVKMWLNPNFLTFTNATPANITETPTVTAPATSLANLGGFILRQDTAALTPAITFDELRIAETTGQLLSVAQSEIAGLNVYPNPTTGIFYVETALNGVKNITVYDILGKQVLNTTTSSTEINAANLNSGLYIVKITEEGKTATKKLIIE